MRELLKALNISKNELENIVKNNTRYIFSQDKRFIKAAHGHSIPIKYTNEAMPPEYLYHGTAKKFMPSIEKEGLKKMSREAVHLSEDPNTAFKIGLRHASGNPDNVVVIRIDATKMYNDDIKFYKSEDSVWLTDHVLPEYFVL